jgi:hypothetical protein
MIDFVPTDYKHPALYKVARRWRRWLLQILTRLDDGLGSLPRLASGPCTDAVSGPSGVARFPIGVLSAQHWYVIDVDDVSVRDRFLSDNCLADAYVLTDHGVQLIFKASERRFASQSGDCRYAYAGASRGFWPMRLSSKEDRARARHMFGLTSAGRELAQAWNACANYAASLDQKEVDQLPRIR